MEGIINVQNSLCKSIEKGLINFKKSPKDRITIEYLETRLENLERDWQLFHLNNTKLYENYPLSDIEKSSYGEEDLYDKTEDTYILYKSTMKTEIKRLLLVQRQCVKDVVENEPSSSFVKLPKISIPIFSGKYSEWPTFRDLFVSLVDKNKALDNVQKLHYLKGHLTGEAEQLIRNTPITGANYSQCWDLLDKRYNNKRYLSNCILKRLFGQKRLNFESASGLKELLDNTSDCLNALRNLNVDVNTWDIIVIHIVTFKLDPETRKHWELNVSGTESNELPTLKQFQEFIEQRFRALECLDTKRPQTYQVNAKSMLVTNNNTVNLRCEFCSEGHKLCFCKEFAKQGYEHRREFVIKNRMCFNCLGGNHSVYECKKPTTCKLCKKRHHSLLHPTSWSDNKVKSTVKTDQPSTSSSTTTDSPIVSCLSTGKLEAPKQVLLATALINASAKGGYTQILRALLDQGSQACFVTEATVQLLKLKKRSLNGVISGIGENKSVRSKGVVDFTIQSRVDPSCKIPIKAFVLPSITSQLPEKTIQSVDWMDLKYIQLADPQYNASHKIDILLGAEVYSLILREGVKRCTTTSLIAQNTTLGWILSGSITNTNHSDNEIRVMHVQVNEDEGLKKFWELEDQPTMMKNTLTEDEKRCEEIFQATTRRTSEGRYVVKLPFRDDSPECKNFGSRSIAEARFKSLERRLAKNQDLKDKYKGVIDEYLQLGHMRPVNNGNTDEAVYLPHHAVIRDDKATTKVRVVFNASEKNKKGVSLNDTLMVGPTLQADLRHTVLRWRVHACALVADIIKMYRQVWIADEDTKYQRILWRDDPEKKIEEFELLTVTFGTASAPYLAVKALQQAAHDEGSCVPLAAEKVKNNFYMDDLMTGSANVEEGKELYKQISGILEKGGFKLQKWSSNNNKLMKNIEEMEKEKDNTRSVTENDKDKEARDKKNTQDNSTQDASKIKIKLDNTIKILGLTWDRDDDVFQYTVNLPSAAAPPVTKRAIISDIAKLFDPLGWIAPTIILAKVFIQRLWLAGVTWDERLPTELINDWETYRQSLQELYKIRIPRWINMRPDDVDVELHGFSDASKSAYAAVVYIRVIDCKGQVKVHLLSAKTRVAPIKQVSIPRLELCGAVLLSRLLTETANVLNIPKEKIVAWTDSTIVLAWLNSHPSRWKTFVANRTSEILTNLNASQWFHVSTKNNPADLASRGALPCVLSESKLWVSGPETIREQTIIYTKPAMLQENLEESVKTHVTTTDAKETSIFERFSSLQRLLRVIAYCRRFLKKGKNECEYLRKPELDEALYCCIRKTQSEAFPIEYMNLESKNIVQVKSSPLRSLCPFMDKDKLIRVGGRLQKAELDENVKHPIVLPKEHHFTRLLVADAHNKTLHGGLQLMTNYLRSTFWIVGGRNIIKKYVRECVVCAKQRACTQAQMMGSLPSVRCKPARAFWNSGVDYAGPINVRCSKGRGHRSYKGYIALFVCMSTRAIHLELVSDMTAQAFLAAFRRFTARRGHCRHIYSDNGTTFVGANKELQHFTSTQRSIAQNLEVHDTQWHFIPPHAPNFGGLWEAGVKSAKFHLKRVIGESTLTFEEMSTLLTQVEACLNSRPISVINSEDPNAALPLTPGHFLIGEPLLSAPELNFENSSVNCLSRWQFVQRTLQTFWRRWSQEYLSNLVNRYKWRSQVPEPDIGQIVLVKEDDLPPSRWMLARILKKHPGTDNITRVVTLRTQSSVIKRPTSKLCILPIAV